MIGAPVSGLVPTTSLNCRLVSRGTVITVAIIFSPPFLWDLNQVKPRSI